VYHGLQPIQERLRPCDPRRSRSILRRSCPPWPAGRGAVGPAWRLQRFFAELGPDLITGAAADDPSGISTYSVAGAAFGYAPLWTALFSFPLMAAVQLMCAFMTL
jgi:hypothetical protein